MEPFDTPHGFSRGILGSFASAVRFRFGQRPSLGLCHQPVPCGSAPQGTCTHMGGVPVTSTLVPIFHSHGFTQWERSVRHWNLIP
jgi:hypothetical protein